MRLIVQSIAGGFELCARLGLIFVPSQNLAGQTIAGQSAPLQGFDGGRIVHAVLDGSPSARAGIEPRDIIISVDGKSWDSVRHLTFSDRRPSEITAVTFVARYFKFAKVAVRVPPEPYRPLDDIAREAASVVAARPTPDTALYRNPWFDDIRGLVARRTRRR
jgi:membrane-associated protease RseP (regulator of RpoE activity)